MISMALKGSLDLIMDHFRKCRESLADLSVWLHQINPLSIAVLFQDGANLHYCNYMITKALAQSAQGEVILLIQVVINFIR